MAGGLGGRGSGYGVEVSTDMEREAPGTGADGARHGRRARSGHNPALRLTYRIAVFVVGLALIALGGALVVLPGPLTIPPVVLGLWIWSREFAWAHRLWERGRKQGLEAWQHAKRHPVSSTIVTVAGLAAAGAAFWAVSHYQLVARARDLVGL